MDVNADLLGTLKGVADAADQLVLLTVGGTRAQKIAGTIAQSARAAIARAEEGPAPHDPVTE